MMPSAVRDGWRGAFIVVVGVVCGNEKGPVSSMGVDGTGLDGMCGRFICLWSRSLVVLVVWRRAGRRV